MIRCRTIQSVACAVMLASAAMPVTAAVTSAWDDVVGGNWSDPNNWTNGVPNGIGDAAIFQQDISANQTVILDVVGGVTLGSVTLRDFQVAPANVHGSNHWTISGTQSIKFDNGGAGASISAGAASGPANDNIHVIATPVVLDDNLAVGVMALGGANSIQLDITGNISSGVGKTTGLTINNTNSRAMRLSGNNSYTGSTTLNAGARLVVNHANAIPTGSAVNMNNAALVTSNNMDFSRNITLTGNDNRFTAAGFGQTFTLSGNISGTGKFIHKLPGGFGPNTTAILKGTNTYEGGTDIDNSSSILRVGAAANVLPDVGTVTVYGNATGGNTLDLNDFNETIGALASARTNVNDAAAGAKVLLGTATLTTGDATNTVFEGVISESGAIVKQGTGSFTLTNANTYTGGTTVNQGALLVTNTTGSGTGTGAVTVNNGGTLGGSGTITGSVTIAGGTVSPGNSPGTLATGNTAWTGAGDYNWQVLDAAGAAGTGYDLLAVTGTLDLSLADGFAINLWSLSGISPDANGDAQNFDNTQSYAWTLASATSGIVGFDASNFLINTAAVNGTGGFSNALPPGGSFTLVLANDDKDLVLTYNVPEPASLALLALGGLAASLRPRRRMTR